MPPKLAVPAPKKAASVSRSESSSSVTSSGSEASSANSKLDELSLTKDQVVLLKNAFTAFDAEKKGCIGIDMIGTILELLGHAQTQAQLEEIVKEVDVDGELLYCIGNHSRTVGTCADTSTAGGDCQGSRR
ncbi:uncharacterized protein LOC129004948 [Macrosteles quadrilineatus]|uniref:uncharacterized protein LOC129004948 n=1 Tax=Macrosteles quadrilineatus TaxID=74068 RepID=UPI0023E27BA7|nr:uncharacterized protein LOC129004948 [Macrosteles quadrilineatus]